MTTTSNLAKIAISAASDQELVQALALISHRV